MTRSRRPAVPRRDRVVEKVVPITPSTVVEHKGPAFRVTEEMLARARVMRPRRRAVVTPEQMFALPEFPPGVAPKSSGLAQDANISDFSSWAIAQQANAWIGSAFAEGQMFLGYSLLSTLAQRPEYRVPTEEIASEMTREWIDIKRAGEEEKSQEVKDLEDEVTRLNVRGVLQQAAEHDGFFGRGHVYLDLDGENDDREELLRSIGDGRDAASRNKVSPDRPLRALRTVEPVWTYPNQYNSNNPLREDWYRPETWSVMGLQVHRTRLLTVIGRPVPDMLKPAYAFGGLAMSQMLKPYVDNWLRTRQAVSDLIHSFSVSGLKTNMAATAGLGGQEMLSRVDLFNTLRDNAGAMVLDKDSEEWFNVSTPLSTLDQLQAQAQEHMACLPGDTLIETDRGLVPIRDVTTSDKVMTRQGLAPLAWAGKTGYTTELVEIKTSSAILQATSWHPIFLPEINEFVDARNVLVGDRLLEGQTSIINTAIRSYGAVTGSEHMGPRVVIGMLGLVVSFIGRSGLRIKDRFRRGSTCITSMRTPVITNYQTWNSRHVLSITSTTCAMAGSGSINSTLFGRNYALFAGVSSKLSDIALRFIAVVDVRTKHIDVGTAYQEKTTDTSLFASDVSKPSKLLWSRSVDSIAARNAHDEFILSNRENESAESDTLKRVRTAVLYLKSFLGRSRRNAFIVPKAARVGLTTVVSTKIIKTSEPVYNLEVVEGFLPEFYANGILVHNSISRIPLVKLLGLSPHGLNASSEGELRAFYDWIKAFQDRLFRASLTTILGFIQLSLWGKVDPSITFEFNPLWQLDEAQKATVEQTKAATHQVYVDMGAVSPDEVREALAGDHDSAYDGIDLSDPAPGPPDQGGGEAPTDGGGSPVSPPSEEDATDDAELGVWRRKAAALFADEDDLRYWARRAERLFEDRAKPDRWCILAQKLFETSNTGEPLLTWMARVTEVRASWSDLAATIPRNVTTEPLPPKTWADRVQRAFPGDLGDPTPEVVVLPPAKAAQAEVDYEYPATGADHCAGCAHFEPTNVPKHCARVDGLIEPEAWCGLFEARQRAVPFEDARWAADVEFEEAKHPRGQPGNAGQFGSGGGSKGGKSTLKERQAARRAETSNLKPEVQRQSQHGFTQYLGMVASAQESGHLPKDMTAPARFILNNGKQFIFDNLSFAGKRGKPHQCFKNAGQLAIISPSKTYVEGYVVVHGVPLEHAWVVDADSKVQDPTITNAKGILGYFGVPIETDYLNKQILKSGHWGLFGFAGTHDLFIDDPKTFVKKGLGEPISDDATPALSDHSSASRLLEVYSKGVTVEALLARQPAEVGRAIRTAEKKLSKGVPTNALVSEGGFKNEDGTYTTERQQLHLKIVSELLTSEVVERATPEPGSKPTFTMIGGRAGSGKSYFTDKGVVGDDSFVLDNDRIKSMLPEYEGWNAALLHEEASDIFDRVDRMARELGINIAHDATLKTYISAQRRVDAYKEQGYKIRGLYMFAPPQEAAERAISRFMSPPPKGSSSRVTGRYVPPSYVLGSTSNEASFDALRDSMDSWKLYKSYDTKEPFGRDLIAEFDKDEAYEVDRRMRAGLQQSLKEK